MAGPLRVMFDSNAFDWFVSDDTARETLRSAVDDARLEVVTTHVQEEQIAGAPPEKRLGWVVQREVAPTAGLVLGLSRLGMARLSGDTEVFDRLTGGSANRRRTTDALIALSAISDRLVLISNDKRLTNAARREGCVVWAPAELAAWAEA